MSSNTYVAFFLVQYSSDVPAKRYYVGRAFNKEQFVLNTIEFVYPEDYIVSFQFIYQINGGISKQLSVRNIDKHIKVFTQYVITNYQKYLTLDQTLDQTREIHLKFQRLLELEPRLFGLLDKINAIDNTKKYFCANKTWVQEIQPTYTELIGHYCKSKYVELHTSQAYDIGRRYLYDQLPACRNCFC